MNVKRKSGVYAISVLAVAGLAAVAVGAAPDSSSEGGRDRTDRTPDSASELSPGQLDQQPAATEAVVASESPPVVEGDASGAEPSRPVSGVSYDEYVAAMRMVLDCVNADGIVIDPSSVDFSRIPISFEVASSVSVDPEVANECYNEYGATADRSYQLRPDVQQARIDAYDPVAQCLADGGFDLRSMVEVVGREQSIPHFEELSQDERIKLAASAIASPAAEDSFASCMQLHDLDLPE
jgi:hypothetical protein